MSLEQLNREVVACRRCARLVAFRQRVASEKKRMFQNDVYWGRPVPGFGDPSARILILGLAPAAHGSNRTGRMFTGDGTDGAGSSDFLMRALHAVGLANQPGSQRAGDGLALHGAYMTAIVRCAPPGNKPTSEEIRACAPFLARELALLSSLRAVVALGKLAFDQLLRLWTDEGVPVPKPRPPFAHGAELALPGKPVLLGAYHPSRQNTQTGKLTPAMFEAVLRRALELSA